MINVLMLMATLNSVMQPDMRSLMVRIGGMSSWILTEISSMEDNSGKYFCLQMFCRQNLIRARFFRPDDVYYKKEEAE